MVLERRVRDERGVSSAVRLFRTGEDFWERVHGQIRSSDFEK